MTPASKQGGKGLRRHVLGEGYTRFALTGIHDRAIKVWLVEKPECRGLQTPVILRLQKWDKKVRLVLEEIGE